MQWDVMLYPDFENEVRELNEEVRKMLAARVKLLAAMGPTLGRPHVDTLAHSRYANMKELRFDAAGGVWRVAFAFDPERQAVLLVAGDKSGTSQKAFYKKLIAKADKRFAQWLDS